MKDNWQSINTAPKDGRAILLLSAAYDDQDGSNDIIHHPPKVSIGYWHPDGHSWQPMGPGRDAVYHLSKTGVWNSGGGWFEPDEVTHWMELPAPPAEENK